MASLNKVFLLGNLTRDPDLRFTSSGAAVCEMGLAVSRRYTVNNEERTEVCYVDIIVWGKPAESCKQYLAKGAPALIEGRLQFDQWDSEGGKRSKLRVVADRVQFVGSRRGADGDMEANVSNAPRQESPARPAQSAPPAMPAAAFNPSDNADDDIPF